MLVMENERIVRKQPCARNKVSTHPWKNYVNGCIRLTKTVRIRYKTMIYIYIYIFFLDERLTFKQDLSCLPKETIKTRIFGIVSKNITPSSRRVMIENAFF